ncbi:hypothetical protein HYV84_05150 [Candidatus Woesearchaeota archaeon]|nr:hypothetical protein [Candidatus Woesearchaeota archaeon]
MQTQILFYVMTVIIFGFILLYGYNALSGLGKRTEQISFIKLKTDLTSSVERIATDFGTVKREEFSIGGDIKEVCFVQTFNRSSSLSLFSIPVSYPFIWNSVVESGSDHNVFVMSTELEESFAVGPINIKNPAVANPRGFLCIPIVRGNLRVQFQGMGNHALLSPW